jgi:hypothetical protein
LLLLSHPALEVLITVVLNRWWLIERLSLLSHGRILLVLAPGLTIFKDEYHTSVALEFVIMLIVETFLEVLSADIRHLVSTTDLPSQFLI